MHIDITGIHLEVTEALFTHVKNKFQHLERYCKGLEIKVHVTLTVDKKFDHRAEATLHVPRIAPVHAAGNGADMYLAIDALAEKLDRLMAKQKDKRQDHHEKGKGPLPPLEEC